MQAAAHVLIANDLLTPAAWRAAQERLSAEVGYAAASRSSYVVEAISEDLALKQDVLAEMERLAPSETLLASTTSALSPSALQRGLRRPDRLLVTHYIRPAHLMPLCEVVRGEETSEASVQRACAMLQSCGIRPVLCRDVPGFVFNRLQAAILREFVHLVEQGHVTPETVDAVMKYGYAHRLPAMGTFEHADLSGIDLVCTVSREIWPDLSRESDPDATLLGRLRAEGRLGMKSGRGFYEWSPDDAARFRRERDREIARRLRILRDEGAG
jgi:3-hydroxybutyryl-CoA dehydrogenase